MDVSHLVVRLENLRDLLGNDIPQERINAIIKEADLTEDNRISYPEFLALWEENPSTPTSGDKPRSISSLDTDESSTEKKSDTNHKMSVTFRLGFLCNAC